MISPPLLPTHLLFLQKKVRQKQTPILLNLRERERTRRSRERTRNMNNQNVDDHNLLLISQLYPTVYTPFVPEQEESKPAPRRRRRKSKSVAVEESGDGSNGWFRKRKLTDEQVRMLEISFGDDHKLESERKDRLASELGLDPRQVAVWFQNRRARWKNKRLEDEYTKLKNVHENVVVEKCRLDSEVHNLKEQLNEAEREIQRLAQRVEGTSSNSPISSSVTVEANHLMTPFFGDYEIGDDGAAGYENLFYSPDYIDGLEWMSQQFTS